MQFYFRCKNDNNKIKINNNDIIDKRRHQTAIAVHKAVKPCLQLYQINPIKPPGGVALCEQWAGVLFRALRLVNLSLQNITEADGSYTVELQWLEHLWNHENMFETGVVRANEY